MTFKERKTCNFQMVRREKEIQIMEKKFKNKQQESITENNEQDDSN